jgi:hypothetical protein
VEVIHSLDAMAWGIFNRLFREEGISLSVREKLNLLVECFVCAFILDLICSDDTHSAFRYAFIRGKDPRPQQCCYAIAGTAYRTETRPVKMLCAITLALSRGI